jgi:hypothetical protein
MTAITTTLTQNPKTHLVLYTPVLQCTTPGPRPLRDGISTAPFFRELPASRINALLSSRERTVQANTLEFETCRIRTFRVCPSPRQRVC